MSEWISVKDRLPEAGEEVATAVYYASGMNTHNDHLIDRDGELQWYRSAWECVTHWMPLPDPPK